MLLKQLLLDGAHLKHSCVVGTKQLVELVNVFHVVLLLQRDVNDRVGDVFADAIQELGFTDDNLQSGVEVDLEFLVVTITNRN